MPAAGKASPLGNKGDFVKKFLEKAERADPSTHETAKQRPEKREHARHIEKRTQILSRKRSLQGSKRAGHHT